MTMPRVPTWTELRMDATKLYQLQRECYDSVHRLLERDIPELDRKISYISNTQSNNLLASAKHQNVVPPIQSEVPNLAHIKDTWQPVTVTIKNSKSLDSVQAKNFKYPEVTMTRNQKKEYHVVPETRPKIPEVVCTKNRKEDCFVVPDTKIQSSEVAWMKNQNRDCYDAPDTQMKSPQKTWTKNQRKEYCGGPERHTRSHEYTGTKNQRKEYYATPVTLNRSPEVVQNSVVLSPHINPVKVHEPKKVATMTRKVPEVIHFEEPNIEELEHLHPPPLPLSYYFQKNRPGLVLRVNSRIMYLRCKSEKRKQMASTRIINSLEKIRLSSRNGSNYQLKQSQKDYIAPKYQVQCRLSEYEMRRLTAKTYKRLPEVKKRKREEFSNHMKVQNYKNKLEYGRKLLENRRHGIINYPLRSSCDDRSITSSQSDFF